MTFKDRVRENHLSSVSFSSQFLPRGYENFKIGGPEAGQLIRELQDDYTWNSRIFAMEALATIKDPRAVAPLCKILTEQDAASRANPISYSATDKDSNSSSLACLKAKACETLGAIGDRRAVQHLIDATMDSAKVVRREAIRALGRIKDKRAVEPLLSALTNGNEEAACALGEIGDQRAVEYLINTLLIWTRFSLLLASEYETLWA